MPYHRRCLTDQIIAFKAENDPLTALRIVNSLNITLTEAQVTVYASARLSKDTFNFVWMCNRFSTIKLFDSAHLESKSTNDLASH